MPIAFLLFQYFVRFNEFRAWFRLRSTKLTTFNWTKIVNGLFILRPFHCCLPNCRPKIFCGEIFKRKSNSWHHSDAARCPCAGCAVHGNKIDLIDLSNSCSFGVDFIVEMERNLSSFFIGTPKYKSLLFLLASAFFVKNFAVLSTFFETTLHFWQRLSGFFRCLF